jgi:hypothetical protein
LAVIASGGCRTEATGGLSGRGKRKANGCDEQATVREEGEDSGGINSHKI